MLADQAKRAEAVEADITAEDVIEADIPAERTTPNGTPSRRKRAKK
jgi:hypothetical protein